MEIPSSFSKKSIDLTLVTLGLALIIVSGYFTWSTSYVHEISESVLGRIITCNGGCKYKTPSDYFWLNGQSDMPVVNKSLIFAPINSKTIIELSSGNKLTLYPNTIIQIKSMANNASIDIISGKMEYKRVNKNEKNDIITINGVKAEMVEMVTPEPFVQVVSALPERLEATAIETVYLRDKPISTEIEIKNGNPPFELHVEDFKEFGIVKTNKKQTNYTFNKPGIYNLRISDSNGNSTTKLIQVQDLSAPQITYPSDGDYVYQENFKIRGTFSEMSEILITSSGNTFFRGPIANCPKVLPEGKYELKIRNSIENQFTEWSSPVSFMAVKSIQPKILSQEELYFNKAFLKWKRTIPVVHKLVLRNEDTGEEIYLNIPEEEFIFYPQESGHYSWSIFPLISMNTNEVPQFKNFTYINLKTVQHFPTSNSKVSSDNITENVSFSWFDLSNDQIITVLEIVSEDFSKQIDVTNLYNLDVELKTNQVYRWRLVFKFKDQKATSEFRTFSLIVPQPLSPIRVEEIIIKD